VTYGLSQNDTNEDGAPDLIRYQAMQGVQETTERISLLVRPRQTSKEDEPRFPS
jgi:hypothetical protein